MTITIAVALFSLSVAESPPPNFGIDVERLRPMAERVSINETLIDKGEARRLLGQDALTDDRAKLRLTIIGAPEECRRVIDDLHGPLADLAGQMLVQSYSPDHWVVVRSGFRAAGAPTIYIQEPGGRVLHRQDDYADGHAGLRRAVEAIRAPDPNYDPARDLDRRVAILDSPMSWLGVLGWVVAFALGGVALRCAKPSRRG